MADVLGGWGVEMRMRGKRRRTGRGIGRWEVRKRRGGEERRGGRRSEDRKGVGRGEEK